MKKELMEILLTKIKNAFYVIDDNEYPQSEDICSLTLSIVSFRPSLLL